MARVQLTVQDISRVLQPAPAAFTATGTDGFYFDNTTGNVILEVVSSTTGQSFTINTGFIVNNEWSVADDLINVSAANTTYHIGPYPQNIYNQPDDSGQVWVDHAVNAVLQFRAFRLP